MTFAIRADIPAICGAVLLALSAPAARAAPEGWDCTLNECVATRDVPIAEMTGTFEHGTGLTPATDIDRLARLEQQRWREYRFVVTEPARVFASVTVDPDYRPADWPAGLAVGTVMLARYVSQNGEVFRPIEDGADLAAGTFLSIIVQQQTAGLGGDTASYFPARWTVTVAARRVAPPEALAGIDLAAPLLLPDGGAFDATLPADHNGDVDAAIGALLDCGDTGCVAPAEADPPASAAAPETPATPAQGADPMAVELQTELARLGCYTGAIDGLWGAGSRGAMARFNAATGQDVDPANPSPAALVAAARVAEPVCAGGDP
ncbi:MAG: peptidoglycan-binding protein [Rhodobacter sp.]|nr:peptidoglycan-binding protein [Rhodobacter sp.]